MTERGDAQFCHSATWGRLTDRFRSLGRVCCLSTALLQFNPQVSMQCPEPSDVGLPVDGQSGGLSLYLKPPGSRQQHLFQGISHIPPWLDFVSSQWLHLLLDEGSSKKSDEPYLPEVALPNNFLFWIQDLLFMFLVVITESELLAHEMVCQRQAHD